MKTKAIILDFDGLIVDTEAVWEKLFIDYFHQEHDFTLTPADLTMCVGSSDGRLFDFIDSKIEGRVDRKKFKDTTTPQFIEESNHLPLMPGVLDLIHQAKELGLKVALATSSKKERPLYHLERLGIIHHFDEITTSDEVKEAKPAPDLFLLSLEKLDIKPHEAIIFEDSNNGLIAGNTAGIPVVVVPNSLTIHSEYVGNPHKEETLEGFDLEKHIQKL